MDATLRRRMIMAEAGESPTPPTPTNIAYIRNTKGAYIDTGITADNTTRIILYARNINPACSAIFGSRTDSTSDAFGLVASIGSSAGGIRLYNGNDSSTIVQNLFTYLSNYHKYEYCNGELKIDDVIVGSCSASIYSNNYNIYLFGINNGGSIIPIDLPMDISKVLLYKNNVLVRDFTAVNTPDVGLYDAVTKTLFTNNGVGNFSYGTFAADTYTRLEYIECSGQQYFDTNAVGSYADDIVCKFRPMATTAHLYDILGVSNATTGSCRFTLGSSTSLNQRMYFSMGYNTDTLTMYDSTNPRLSNLDLVVYKGFSSNSARAYKNNTAIGSAATATDVTTGYSTADTMLVGGSKGYNLTTRAFFGRFYYVGIGSQCALVPAKVGNVVGMYDTYNDIFHASESDTPFIEGPAINTPTHYFQGKSIAIIGDSISTYNATGYKYDSYRMYYPVGDVDSVNETWWKRLMDSENCSLDVNLAYSGSFSSNHNPDYPTFYDRVSLIGQADIIIVAIGTNDSTQSVTLGEFDYTSDLDNYDMTKFRDSYIKGIRAIKKQYPNSSIVCAIFSMGDDYRNSIKTIAEHYGLKVVDCGNNYQKYTTVHPNAVGMLEIYNNFLYI